MNIEEIRQFFAEEISIVANIQTSGLAAAFAKVPREEFLGPGPWQIPVNDVCAATIGGMTKRAGYRSTPSADPRHLYHNVAIAIDSSRNLNNGQPSSLATWLDALELKAGDHVVHIGCGVGYYTAIIAEVVGPGGKVTGVEIDPDLALRARKNLAHLSQAHVTVASGGDYDPEPTDAIFVNAGATHLRSAWIDALRQGGRLLVPLTIGDDATAHGMGFMLKVERDAETYAARFVSSVMIFPCIGSREHESNQRLLEAMKRGTWGSVKSLRRETHESDETCWLHGDLCLSTLAAGAEDRDKGV